MKIKSILLAALLGATMAAHADTYCGDMASFAESVAKSRDTGMSRNKTVDTVLENSANIRQSTMDIDGIDHVERLSLKMIDAIFYGEHFKYLSPREVGIELFEYCLDDE